MLANLITELEEAQYRQDARYLAPVMLGVIRKKYRG
jgi:hypothetical protein